jgi:hypothetical protein
LLFPADPQKMRLLSGPVPRNLERYRIQHHNVPIVDPLKINSYSIQESRSFFSIEAQRLSLKQRGAQMIMRNPVAAAFLISVLTAVTLVGPAAASAASIEVPRISIERTKQMLASAEVVIIDVRTAKTWWRSNAKIKTAVREEPGPPERWMQKYPKDKTLIFYCS